MLVDRQIFVIVHKVGRYIGCAESAVVTLVVGVDRQCEVGA